MGITVITKDKTFNTDNVIFNQTSRPLVEVRTSNDKFLTYIGQWAYTAIITKLSKQESGIVKDNNTWLTRHGYSKPA